MSMPTPEDMRGAPVWSNYIIAQANEAMIGQIPRHAVAITIEISGLHVTLGFQLSEVDEQDIEDMDDIVNEFWSLVGDEVDVRKHFRVVPQVTAEPPDRVTFIFRAREN